MSAAKRFGLWMLALGFGAITGCVSDGGWQLPPGESLAADLTDAAPVRLARMQRFDAPSPKQPLTSAPLGPTSGLTPSAKPQSSPSAASPSPSGTVQASMKETHNSKVTVRAWVNGHPIFDDEVVQMMNPAVINKVQRMSEPQRSEVLAQEYNKKLDDIIDNELLYQDAVHKLEKANPRALEQIRLEADKEFDKHIKRIRDQGHVSEAELNEFIPTMKKQSQRDFIAMEYIRSRVMGIVRYAIGHKEVQDYYDNHLTEFQKVDTVEWQDIFISTNERVPTSAAAKRLAEDLIAKCRTNEDFVKLLSYDEGDSKFRGGLGLGSRKGEIQPAEVEEYLFRMREGEIGPVVEMTTGAHLFRVLKREYAGQMPLDDKAQSLIKRKLENQVVEREMKSVVRELRGRSVIEIERN